MSLFKANKNKTSSAASTPTQTPRASLNEQRPSNAQATTKMTREQALEMALQKSVRAPNLNFNLL